MRGNYVRQNQSFLPRLRDNTVLQKSQNTMLKLIYFKNFYLKLNFDKYENQQCSPFLIQPKL